MKIYRSALNLSDPNVAILLRLVETRPCAFPTLSTFNIILALPISETNPKDEENPEANQVNVGQLIAVEEEEKAKLMKSRSLESDLELIQRTGGLFVVNIVLCHIHVDVAGAHQ